MYVQLKHVLTVQLLMSGLCLVISVMVYLYTKCQSISFHISHIVYLRIRNDLSGRDCGETETMIGEVGECYKSPVVRRCPDILAIEVGVLPHVSAVRFVVRNQEL